VHYRTIQIKHQPNATVFQFIILTFVYSSTCFGRFPAHHQELNDCSGTLWFYLCILVIVVLFSWSGRPVRSLYIYIYIVYDRRSQWQRGLRRRSASARLLGLWVWIPPGAWMSVSCECCVMSGRVLGDELIIRSEESYRLWCVVLCGVETS
jgi:hypothetical protein